MIGFIRRSLTLVSAEPTTDRVSSSVLGTLVDRSGRELNHIPPPPPENQAFLDGVGWELRSFDQITTLVWHWHLALATRNISTPEVCPERPVIKCMPNWKKRHATCAVKSNR